MYAIYCNIYHQYIPNDTIYTWILWVLLFVKLYETRIVGWSFMLSPAPVEASLVIDRRDEAMSYFEQVMPDGLDTAEDKHGFKFDGIQWDLMEFNEI